MAQAEAKAIRGSAEPSAAMREVEAIEAKLRAGKPVPTTIPEERALRAEICGYWTEGAPVALPDDGRECAGRSRPRSRPRLSADEELKTRRWCC